MGPERDHASISAGRTQKPGQCWTRSPKGSFSLSPFSLTVIPAPPPPAETHADTYMKHTRSYTHTAVYGPRGYLFQSNKDSATADISHLRQVGHNLGLNVCLVCLYM